MSFIHPSSHSFSLSLSLSLSLSVKLFLTLSQSMQFLFSFFLSFLNYACLYSSSFFTSYFGLFLIHSPCGFQSMLSSFSLTLSFPYLSLLLPKKKKKFFFKKTFFIPGNTLEKTIMQAIITSRKMGSKKGIASTCYSLKYAHSATNCFFQGFSISSQDLQLGKKD